MIFPMIVCLDEIFNNILEFYPFTITFLLMLVDAFDPFTQSFNLINIKIQFIIISYSCFCSICWNLLICVY